MIKLSKIGIAVTIVLCNSFYSLSLASNSNFDEPMEPIRKKTKITSPVRPDADNEKGGQEPRKKKKKRVHQVGISELGANFMTNVESSQAGQRDEEKTTASILLELSKQPGEENKEEAKRLKFEFLLEKYFKPETPQQQKDKAAFYLGLYALHGKTDEISNDGIVELFKQVLNSPSMPEDHKDIAAYVLGYYSIIGKTDKIKSDKTVELMLRSINSLFLDEKLKDCAAFYLGLYALRGKTDKISSDKTLMLMIQAISSETITKKQKDFAACVLAAMAMSGVTDKLDDLEVYNLLLRFCQSKEFTLKYKNNQLMDLIVLGGNNKKLFLISKAMCRWIFLNPSNKEIVTTASKVLYLLGRGL